VDEDTRRLVIPIECLRTLRSTNTLQCNYSKEGRVYYYLKQLLILKELQETNEIGEAIYFLYTALNIPTKFLL
jgi:hypothetical protein